jgi:hypothetical protein
MERLDETRLGVIKGKVIDEEGSNGPIDGAYIFVHPAGSKGGQKKPGAHLYSTRSGHGGVFEIEVPADQEYQEYEVHCEAFDLTTEQKPATVTVTPGKTAPVELKLPLNLTITPCRYAEGETAQASARAVVGVPMFLRVGHSMQAKIAHYKWSGPLNASLFPLDSANQEMEFTPVTPGSTAFSVTAFGHSKGGGEPPEEAATSAEFFSSDAPVQKIAGKVGVTLERTASNRTADQALWSLIRNRTRAISFSSYSEFIHRVLCRPDTVPDDPKLRREKQELGNHVSGVGAYQLLKTATEVFLLLECGVCLKDTRSEHRPLFDGDEESARWGEPVTFDSVKANLQKYLGDGPHGHHLPYITDVIRAAFPGLHQGRIFCDRVLTSRANEPCMLELIWSYWHEEGMLVQTMNAVSRRFQNVRAPSVDRDPLAHMETDPLRPLNNLLWGRIQDEQSRLTVVRRAYEYDHHYGLTLYGKVVQSFRPADSRSKFLEGFHNLLHLCSIFFKEDNDTTVIADGFPLLNALKEVHLLLAQGAHNQFGDLPWTARAEMLVQEWLIARSEMREFLQSRAMVPYKEPWMPQVDTMKTMQGWSDVTVTHFRDLGVYGEQLLLSIRYGDWINVDDEDSAKNWARYWRSELQAYLHAYRAATGIDLTNPDTVDATMPGVLLQKRLAIQQRAR